MIRKRESGSVFVLTALVVLMLFVCLPAEAAQSPPKQNIVHVAADGTGDYKTDGTDDQVEINKALLDIHKKGGGTVHIKKGTYTIGDSIIVHGNTVLEGDGWTSVIKLKKFAGWPKSKPMIGNGKNASGITIRNLKIDGNRGKRVGRKWSNQKEGWGAYYYNGIEFGRVDGVILSGLRIGNNLNDQIKLRGCKNITIRDCTLADGGHDCIQLLGCDTADVINNRMILRCNCGIRLGNTNHVLVKGNTLHPVLKPVNGKGGSGIQIQYSTGEMNDILIEGNTIFAVRGGGIAAWVDRMPKKSGLCKIKVRNNVFYHCNGGGIRTTNFEMLIENNTIFQNRGFGIAFPKRPYSGVRDEAGFPVIVTARNNIIVNNAGHGLTTSGHKNFRIVGSCNNVWGNTSGDYDGNVKTERDISVNPLFVKTDVPFTHGMPVQLKMDLHLKSRHGRWDGKKWVKDDMTSPCIDAGDPKADCSKEPAPNGRRINMGGYGNTKEASKSKSK